MRGMIMVQSHVHSFEQTYFRQLLYLCSRALFSFPRPAGGWFSPSIRLLLREARACAP
jgi:hypothetical protein